MAVNLFKHQHEFVTDISHRYLCLRAGYGAGKSFAFCFKAIHLASLNIGNQGLLCEPTGDLINTVLIPTMEECLDIAGIKYTLKRAPLPEMTLKFKRGETKILFRSGENFQRLVGVNVAFVGVDELDTINPKIAAQMWKKLQGRMRKGRVFQMFCTSTPEGFRFMHQFFVKDPSANPDKAKQVKVIHARTMDNTTLPPEFIEDLLLNYTEEEVQAYVYGNFVNMVSGRIYRKFDRIQNHINITLDDIIINNTTKKDIYGNRIPLPTLHIGMDFNINKMAGIVHIIDDLGPIAIDELVNLRDTEQMIEVIKERYPQFKIAVYPDSSGKNRSHASVLAPTDIAMLQQAGFSCHFDSTNPPVKDRINSMNQAFHSPDSIRKYRVNVFKCPQYTECLEQQVYDEGGQPDKSSGFDHANDAAGYFIHSKYPVKRYQAGTLRIGI